MPKALPGGSVAPENPKKKRKAAISQMPASPVAFAPHSGQSGGPAFPASCGGSMAFGGVSR